MASGGHTNNMLQSKVEGLSKVFNNIVRSILLELLHFSILQTLFLDLQCDWSDTTPNFSVSMFYCKVNTPIMMTSDVGLIVTKHLCH